MRLQDSKHLWRVWVASVKASIVREIEFRANFWIGIFRQFLWLGAFILFINIIFAQTKSLAGWSENEVLIILALSRLIEGLMSMLFINNLMMFPGTIKKGTFDTYLLRPVPTQYFTAFRLIDFGNIGNILGGIALLVYALRHSVSLVALHNWPIFFVLIVCGITIYYSLLIIVASLAFVFESLEALWSINYLLSEPLTAPFSVFPRGPQIALTYLIPLAFVVYVPAQALTNKLTFLSGILAVVITIIFLGLANLAWNAGIKKYSSASS